MVSTQSVKTIALHELQGGSLPRRAIFSVLISTSPAVYGKDNIIQFERGAIISSYTG